MEICKSGAQEVRTLGRKRAPKETGKLRKSIRIKKCKTGDGYMTKAYSYLAHFHATMVTENGGTIQNGESHNGVWESSQSPEDMFGGVTGYIATSSYFTGARESIDNLRAKTLEWEETLNRINDSAQDLALDLTERNKLLGLEGVRKDYQELLLETDKYAVELERKYRDMALKFAKASVPEQGAMGYREKRRYADGSKKVLC